MELISVIVPVFNGAPYLSRCIDSVLKQTYENLQILIIDDGSEDDSLNIAREYERKDKRIRVFHQANQGVSSARNKGIQRSEERRVGKERRSRGGREHGKRKMTNG